MSTWAFNEEITIVKLRNNPAHFLELWKNEGISVDKITVPPTLTCEHRPRCSDFGLLITTLQFTASPFGRKTKKCVEVFIKYNRMAATFTENQIKACQSDIPTDSLVNELKRVEDLRLFAQLIEQYWPYLLEHVEPQPLSDD